MRNFFAITWLWLALLAGEMSTLLHPSSSQSFSSPLACNVTVNAGNDQTVCDSNQVVNLSATITGNYLSAIWSPSIGIADTSLLSTQAIVDTTTTYRMTVRSINDQNLITNGNFNAGNTGFTSDYTNDTQDIRQEGKYAVVRRANDVRNSFQNCSDHTGGGFMMVVNASGQPNNVWCQTITVTPNTGYTFGAWAASMTSQNPARLQFSINGNLIGAVFTASSQTCNWREFTANWTSGSASTAKICIANVNNTPAGNDFAIDDLSFRQICETTDEVTITVAKVNAEWTSRDTFCRNEPSFALNTLLDPSATTGGTWTINGNPATIFDPSQVTLGINRVRYTVQVAGCQKNKERNIIITAPANAGTTLAPLHVCAGVDTTIALADLIQGEDGGGIWSNRPTPPAGSGSFNAGLGTFRTANQRPGNYNFRYRLDAPGACPDAEVTVNVIIDSIPIADAGEDLTLNCLVDIVTIGGSRTSTGNNLRYNWISTNGSAIVDPFLAMTEVEAADNYTLVVTNSANGCTAQDTVTVTANITKPSAALEVKQLTCNQTRGGAIRITATGESPFEYALDNGNFSAKNEFQSLAPGNYFITVRDKNGCDTTLQATLDQPEALDIELQVNINETPPALPMGDSAMLTLQLSKPLSSIVSIAWSPDSIGCNTCNTAVVNPMESTTYKVQVTDVNGCIATAELLLFVQQLQRVFMPTAFSPNGDGTNDFFYISAGSEIRSVKAFRILNRWGALVFNRENIQPNDPGNGWDGTFQGKYLQNGVYVYVAELELSNGEIVVIKGDVAVVR